jgi:hypothetical protein
MHSLLTLPFHFALRQKRSKESEDGGDDHGSDSEP